MTQPTGQSNTSFEEEYWKWIGFGAHKVSISPIASRREREARNRAMLARALARDNVVAMVGAGLSQTLGFPDWAGLVTGSLEEAISYLDQKEKPEQKDQDWLNHLEEIRRKILEPPKKVKETEGKNQRVDPKTLPEKQKKKYKDTTVDEKMYITAVCQQLIQEDDDFFIRFNKWIEVTFGEKKPAEYPKCNPYKVLMGLPIHRFITTNYDVEIERAITSERFVPYKKFGIGNPFGWDKKENGELYLSFTQRQTYCDQHARFFLYGDEVNRNMVFHTHGRYDDFKSIIASEGDYQRWYLSKNEGAGAVFKEKIGMMLASNPLLFVGYSLGDEDLMGILRSLGAQDPERKHSRPLFALVREDQEKPYDPEVLYEKYGLHVITFSKTENKKWGEVFCAALQDIAEQSLEIRARWLERPAFQSTTFQDHHALMIFQPRKLASRADRACPHVQIHVEQILERLKLRNGKWVSVIGKPDTGKTIIALQTIAELRKRGEYQHVFYWNAHYSDDAVSLFHFLEGFVKKRKTTNSLTGKLLVVVDGAERLLHREVFDSENKLFSRIFNTLHSQDPVHFTLLLVGRNWLRFKRRGIKAKATNTRRVEIDAVQPHRLANSGSKFARFGEPATFFGLTEGHWFAQHLLYFYMLKNPLDLVRGTHPFLIRLAETSPQDRARKIFDESTRWLDRDFCQVVSLFLKRIAAFVKPLEEDFLSNCFDQVKADAKNDDDSWGDCDSIEFEPMFRRLLALQILLRISLPEETDSGYAVRPVFREFLYGKGNYRSQGAEPSLGFGGTLAGLAPVVQDRPELRKTVQEFSRVLLDQTKVGIQQLERGRDEAKVDSASVSPSSQMVHIVSLLRNAFSLVRSRMNATGTAQADHFKDYVGHGLQLLSMAKWMGRSLRGDVQTQPDGGEILVPSGPLFPGNLAWLYNDLGFAFLLEGFSHDALELWEQGFQLCRHMEEPFPDQKEMSLTMLVNIGIGCIDIGSLQQAELFLKDARRLNEGANKIVKAKIQAFLGVVQHMRANYRKAEIRYQNALDFFEKRKNRNTRAQSVIYRYQSGLYRRLEKPKKAEESLLWSIAAANAGGHEDLLLFATIDEARLTMAKNLGDADRLLRGVITKACNRRFQKLEGMAKSVLAKVKLKMGDGEGARSLAVDALQLFNGLGLGLRSTRTMGILGQALLLAEERKLARSYLECASERAGRQQYFLCKRRVDQILRGMKEG